MATGALPYEAGAEQDEERGSRVLKRLRRHPGAIIGGAVVAVFILVAALAPWLAPYDPAATNWLAVRQPPLPLPSDPLCQY